MTRSLPPHWQLVSLDTCASTMIECKKRLTQGRTVAVITKTQTAGRGRRGAEWESPQGGLYVTFGWKFPQAIRQWSGLSLAVGVSLIESLSLDTVSVGLKWPNDLIHNGTNQKLGGILIEASDFQGSSAVMVGVGINCSKTQTHGAISLEELFQATVSPELIFHEIAVPLEDAVTLFSRLGFGAFRERWGELCIHQGRNMVVDCEGDQITGLFKGIGVEGSLVLQTEMGEREISAGHLVGW